MAGRFNQEVTNNDYVFVRFIRTFRISGDFSGTSKFKNIGERLTFSYVEFKDGEKVDINNLEYRLIKQLTWW